MYSNKKNIVLYFVDEGEDNKIIKFDTASDLRKQLKGEMGNKVYFTDSPEIKFTPLEGIFKIAALEDDEQKKQIEDEIVKYLEESLDNNPICKNNEVIEIYCSCDNLEVERLKFLLTAKDGRYEPLYDCIDHKNLDDDSETIAPDNNKCCFINSRCWNAVIRALCNLSHSIKNCSWKKSCESQDTNSNNSPRTHLEDIDLYAFDNPALESDNQALESHDDLKISPSSTCGSSSFVSMF